MKALFHAPPAAPWLEPFRAALAAGELRLPRCSACGKWQWYPIETGPACLGATYVWREVGPTATVFSLTRVVRPLLPDVESPYLTGLVVTDEAPSCRIPALLDETGGPVTIGSRVRLVAPGDGDDPLPCFMLEVQS